MSRSYYLHHVSRAFKHRSEACLAVSGSRDFMVIRSDASGWRTVTLTRLPSFSLQRPFLLDAIEQARLDSWKP